MLSAVNPKLLQYVCVGTTDSPGVVSHPSPGMMCAPATSLVSAAPDDNSGHQCVQTLH